MQTTTSRGLRNNNPLNIRKDRTKWQGEKQPSGDPSFKQFTSMAYGYRAAFVLLGTYLTRGWNTIEKIIAHWAPPNENNTAGYIAHVEKWSGVPRTKTLAAAGSRADFLAIVCAMSRVENGVAANPADVEAGFRLQSKLT